MVKKKSCPKGEIKRKAYTTRRNNKNIRVPSSCIRSTSSKQVKRSDIDKAYIAKREKIQHQIAQKYGSKRCSTGQIERAGYTRKSFKRNNGKVVKKSEVPPVCVRDTGKVGKGPKLPLVMEKNILKKFGYNNVKNMSARSRHIALKKAYENMGNSLSLFRRLNIVSTMNRNKDPTLAKIFKDDANWVRKNFGSTKSDRRSGSKTSRSSSGNKNSRKATSVPRKK